MSFEAFFESRGYGPDGVKLPRPDLHVVDPSQLTIIDELQAAGVVIFPDDYRYLQNPQDPGFYTQSTINEYRRLLAEAQARAAVLQAEQPDSTNAADAWQQTA